VYVGRRARLAQDRDQWWAVVSAVMTLRVLAPWSELFITRILRLDSAATIKPYWTRS
jgi:hypothetical protein